jgi:hypothetical protein
VADSIKADLREFLAAFPVEHNEWPAVLAGLKTAISGSVKPEARSDSLVFRFVRVPGNQQLLTQIVANRSVFCRTAAAPRQHRF